MLYRELTESDFAIIPAGEYPLGFIYRAVQARFPDLCDDSYLCSANCAPAGHTTQPEWMHAVRRALAHYQGSRRISIPRRGWRNFGEATS